MNRGAPTDLVAAVRAHADARPDAPALVAGDGRSLTYGMLGDRLAHVGDRGGELHFLVIRETVPQVVRYLELLASGAVVALVPAATPADRARGLLDAYRPSAVHGAAEDLAALGLDLDGAADDVATWRSDTPASIAASELQLLLTTSGSTGSPKLVRLSRTNVAANAAGIADALAITPDEVAVTCLPLYYTYGLSILHSHLTAGAATLCAHVDPMVPTFREMLDAHGVTTLAGVPFSYKVYDRLRLIADPPASLRSMTQAGGKLGADSVHRWAEGLAASGRSFYVMYGQTEATARMSVLPPALAIDHPDTVGFPLPGGRFEIDAADGARDGEVVYHGPNVMLGYADRAADLTDADDLGGVLRTGDLGHLTEEGLLRITGRLKRIAKVNGVRVSLDDVEAMARDHCVAAAIAGEDKVRLFVASAVEDERALRRLLAARAGLSPRDLELVPVDELPVKSSGKFDYAALEGRP